MTTIKTPRSLALASAELPVFQIRGVRIRRLEGTGGPAKTSGQFEV
jgi:hypothetical protein